MARTPSFAVPPRVPAVEPELLASAIFLFGEYLGRLAAESPGADEDEEQTIDTAEVLDLFAEELGTAVPVTITLYMRVTALYRLLSGSPSLARLALEGAEFGGALSEDALLAAARLDLHVRERGGEREVDFDPREFREALQSA